MEETPLTMTREMSRKLLLTQKQIAAICKGAAKAGYVPIIEVEGLNVRLVPEQSSKRLNQNETQTVDKPIAIRF